MRKTLLPAAFMALFLTGISAADGPGTTADKPSLAQTLGFEPVTGEDILATYENKTIEGVYNDYAANVRAGIRPARFTETHFDNATTLYEHRGKTDYTIKGIYTVKKDQICYQYNAPGKAVGNFCFYVFKQENCYFHFYEPFGYPETEEAFKSWASMAYAKEDVGTCLPNIA